MVFLCLVLAVGICALLRYIGQKVKQASRVKYLNVVTGSKEKNELPFTVGFFHPFCNSGGGGERVLWSCIRALQSKYANCTCVIYTGDLAATANEIIQKANERFTIQLDAERTRFVYLRTRFLVDDKLYPVFTLLGQSLGAMLLGLEAFCKFIPDVYFETTGYAFTYPLFAWFASTPVCCYTHYPTISTDMLEAVYSQQAAFNNRSIISKSKLLTHAKMAYYRLFALLYKVCGRRSSCVMTNSSWTHGHIKELWSMGDKARIVYPPCDVVKFEAIFDDARHDANFYISSVAQFRPEKNHSLQVRAFAQFLNKLKESNLSTDNVQLHLIGSCRHEEDMRLVDGLKALAASLGVADKVHFSLNFTFKLLLQKLAESAVGVHSMVNEHFGIGIVECMAAGTVMIAHDSAGPQMDIVVPHKGQKTGFLATSETDYCDAFYTVYTMEAAKRQAIRQAAREHVKRFSQKEFENNFLDAFHTLCFEKFFS